MRRTLERRNFPVSGVIRGEVVVPSAFTHPTRGEVNCPAAPVAVPTGTPVRHAALGTGDNAILHTVSYLDPDGTAVGLAVAAHRDDVHAQRIADTSVTAWAAVMRTRRVLLESTGPSCAGLRHEAAMIAGAGGPVAVLAPDTALREVSSRWPWRDVRPVDRITDLPPGTTVVLPAHGTTASTTDLHAAVANGVRVIDATCPLVTRAQSTARRFATEHAKVVIIAGPEDAAAPALAVHAPDSTIVTGEADLDALTVAPRQLVAYVVSPGLPAEDAGVLASQVRQRFPGTIGQHPDELCYAASDRRAAIRAVASNTELTLVLGTADSIDTRILTSTAAPAATRVERIDTASDLRPDWLVQTTSIGILSSASAPPALAGELLEVLAGLGPLSIAKRTVTTTVEQAIRLRATTVMRAG